MGKGSWSFYALAVPLLLLVLDYSCKSALDLPLANLARNMISPPTPPDVHPKYQCTPESLSKDVTVVVSVKDACSLAPDFIKALHDHIPKSVHLIYTFPNFHGCATLPGIKDEIAQWDRVTEIPLDMRVTPMQGWKDAVAHIDTPYALLLHNDGYGLDNFFTCELVEALKAHKQNDTSYVVAAPMIYESKKDRSLAAHATQSNLRLVKDPNSKTGRYVRHDHSVAKALNRGSDFPEGPQEDFLEDHGFLIETDKITAVIDPHASYTLEYIDMILSIRGNNWKVLFVPTARLEFRVTEFSWRDIPYFMYKRSEMACHRTRDYLRQKWNADFPNTGFWTYIRYTIIEQHIFRGNYFEPLRWSDNVAVAFGFFQNAGFNMYTMDGKTVDFIDVVQSLDAGWSPEIGNRVTVSRNVVRPTWADDDIKAPPKKVDEILETREPATINIEADLPLENLPFATVEFTFNNMNEIPTKLEPLCGVILKYSDKVSCWVDLPTFKSNSLLMRFADKFAALIKLPSRITTFLEMLSGSTIPAAQHVASLQQFLGSHPDWEKRTRVFLCESANPDCKADFVLDENTRVVQFAGRPPAAWEVVEAISQA